MLKKLVADLGKKIIINKAYLFGSYARGSAGKWSDIDLALVSPQFKGTRFYDNKTLIPYLRSYSDRIEVHPFKESEFDSRNLFVREIIRHGVKIK